jgi:DNA-binding NtrC family response regulator
MFASTMLGSIANDHDGAVDRTHRLYIENFGPSRSLSDFEFRQLFGETHDSVAQVRNESDAAPFLERCRVFGDQLAARGVPLGEFVIALQFFEDACLSSPGIQTDVRSHRAFDRLSHQLIASVASAYHGRRTGEEAALRASLERDVARLAPEERTVFHGLVGKSAAMRRLFARLSAAAPRRTTVLLVGETGTGKELCARAIHDLSGRKNGPFVPVNCAAIPREILPSELFGHRRGAFTGAVADSRGLIAAAEHGTLFLDEVTEMDEAAQVALLRVLEMHTVRPIGATGERTIDVRFVAATNRDPEEAVTAGKLRADLFHRLAATTVSVPPLRERMEDLDLLIDYLLVRIARSEHLPMARLANGVAEALRKYSWPGNIRELANCLESAVTFCKNGVVEIDDLPDRILRPGPARAAAPGNPTIVGASASPDPAAARRPAGIDPTPAIRENPASRENAVFLENPANRELGTVREKELELIKKGLAQHGGNKAATARALGISRKRLYAKLREMGLPTDQED